MYSLFFYLACLSFIGGGGPSLRYESEKLHSFALQPCMLLLAQHKLQLWISSFNKLVLGSFKSSSTTLYCNMFYHICATHHYLTPAENETSCKINSDFLPCRPEWQQTSHSLYREWRQLSFLHKNRNRHHSLQSAHWCWFTEHAVLMTREVYRGCSLSPRSGPSLLKCPAP